MTRRGLAFAGVTTATLAVWLLLSVANAPLRTAVAPLGIISFELAGSAARAAEMVASWGPRQREAASFSLGLDFLFLFLYPISISLAVRITADRVAAARPAWFRLGRSLSLMVPACVALDAIENVALWQILQLGATETTALVAAGAATIKFGLVAAGIGYAVLTWLIGRATPSTV